MYHLTHADNLRGILVEGGLRPKAQAPPTVQSVAYPHIQARRAGIKVPLPPGGTLHEYVPFYFCPRPPMLYALAHPRPSELPYQGGQRPILHLVSSVQRVARADLRFVFTDRHATVRYAAFLGRLEDLARLDWGTIGARNWANTKELPDRKERKQAEFLVHGLFPWELVEEIAVMDPGVAAEVRKILQAFPRAPHPPVRVRREWYY
ncbi:type II toxin-antitoxin system toxin DNA ADP-ribosyl transferase DarT [Thermus thermamylovorans]|uniref:type II toxin-antitoxin system toxin DNA ADP-ribosyl transferase DarT n=1 Tax=Thermus thermamylovorans TaxID=2509362 RepID=UPI002ED1A435